MDKMQMANEYLLKIMSNSPLVDQDDIEFAVDTAWNYADAMQAEAERRNQDSLSLTKDQEGNCLHFHHEFGHKKCMDCGASLDKRKPTGIPEAITEQDKKRAEQVYANIVKPPVEWQPDWSQAPNGVTGWSMRADGRAAWHFHHGVGVLEAPSFGYSGPWQESLRKRP